MTTDTATLDALGTLTKEVWKPVPGWEGVYEVSNHGRIKSLPRHRVLAARILSQCRTPKGYVQVNLRCAGRVRHREVHRLVLEAFVGPCPEGMQCCHNDGDPSNNRLENLRWDTPQANSRDQYRHNPARGALCSQPGESNPIAKLSAKQVRCIREEYARGGITQRELGERFGVTHGAISLIIRGKNWAKETA